MKRELAKRAHEATNITFWAENPDWNAGDRFLDFLNSRIRRLPFSVHEGTKKLFFDTDKIIAVNGESVVSSDMLSDNVDKFMFRYPDKMKTEDFRDAVAHEIGAVTCHLAGIALDTQVSIKSVAVFRKPLPPVEAVTQTQPKLDLSINRPFNLTEVQDDERSKIKDNTAKDIEALMTGTASLVETHGYYPDIAANSHNLRRNHADGSVTLIDVMPIYKDGDRLINDGARVLPATMAAITMYEEFIGEYGA